MSSLRRGLNKHLWAYASGHEGVEACHIQRVLLGMPPGRPSLSECFTVHRQSCSHVRQDGTGHMHQVTDKSACRCLMLKELHMSAYVGSKGQGVPVRVPLGLKSSPSRVTHRVRTSLLNARVFAVAESCRHSTTSTPGKKPEAFGFLLMLTHFMGGSVRESCCIPACKGYCRGNCMGHVSA